MKVESAEFFKSFKAPCAFPKDGLPLIAFAGRSNVGKSSLLNRLVRRNGLARTSSTPGRTRLINYFLINRRFYFVDLPGYGYAKVAKSERQSWAVAVDSFLEFALPDSKIVLLVDGKIAGTSLDAEAYAYLTASGADPVVAVTKMDRVSRNKRPRCLKQVRTLLGLKGDAPLIPVSAQTGEGLAQLWREIAP